MSFYSIINIMKIFLNIKKFENFYKKKYLDYNQNFYKYISN